MRRNTLIALGLIAYCALHMDLSEAWCADNEAIEKQTLVFVITGESNSGGVGRNAKATPKEMSPRPSVQVMNLTDGEFGFEPLQLGVNNLRDHFRMSETHYANWHGFENELANAVERGDFSDRKQVYLIKTGHGGSRVAQWTVGNPSGFWKKFVERVEAGKKQVPENAQWVVWFSLGINDAIDEKPIELWEKEIRAHLKKIQKEVPGGIIVMTQFQAMGNEKKYGIYPETDAAIARIAADVKGVYAVDSAGAELVDKNHWSYEGLKTVVQRMVEITQQVITQAPAQD